MAHTTDGWGPPIPTPDPSPLDCRPHKLIVRVVGEAGGHIEVGEFEDFEIVHYDDCPRHLGRCFDDSGEDKALVYDCWVGQEAKELDVRWSLTYSGTSVTEPGEYMIEAWAEVFHGMEYTEYDGGLRLCPKD